jgi:hypothetical protein
VEHAHDDQQPRPVFRLLRPFWWVAHALTGYKLLALLLGGILVGRYWRPPIQDINNLRNLASYLQLSGSDPLPLAPDGRIDVYVFVREGLIEGEDDLQTYGNNATGQQPTLEEMLAGDYSNFGYQRFRGEVSPNENRNIPLLWDKQPRRGSGGLGRVVALTGGRATFWDEAEFQKSLRAHGQEEPHGRP